MLRTAATRSLARAGFFTPAARAPARRAFHPVNVENHTMPFGHGREHKLKFSLIYWGALSVSGIVVPCAAMYLQLYKGGAYDTLETAAA